MNFTLDSTYDEMIRYGVVRSAAIVGHTTTVCGDHDSSFGSWKRGLLGLVRGPEIFLIFYPCGGEDVNIKNSKDERDMSEILVEVREQVGSRVTRRLRRQGRVPVVMYGGEVEGVQHLSVERRIIKKLLQKDTFFIEPLSLAFEGQSYTVLPRQIQLDPLTSTPIHVDFLRITPQTRIIAKIPCTFIRHEQCPGLRRGGLLNVVRHTIEVHCRAMSIPRTITVDLSSFQINQSVHISHVTLPEGVTPTIQDRNFTIATIVPPST